MSSICNFIPAKKSWDQLKIIHFVYETEINHMKQPFMHPIYYMHLVCRGTATLKMAGKESPLTKGTLFFTFPLLSYEITDNEDFIYMYISFMGTRGSELMEQLGVSEDRPVYNGFDDEIPAWRRAIQRINPQNANLLTESIMLHTLSFLTGGGNDSEKSDGGVLANILKYIDNNYTDPDISLKKIAGIYAYTDKYLSHLFKTQMNINWSSYINKLRIQHSIRLIGEGITSLYELATFSGYRDPMYFSKVFKSHTGDTPRAYIAKLQEGNKGTEE